MKKNLPVLFLCAFMCTGVNNAIAQSPRLQLFEYFDNSSIPPFGAAANAHFDSLALANTGTMTFIKYHVYWGDQNNTDPMNLENPAQPAARVTYYGVNEDPIAYQDGGDTLDFTYSGAAPDTFVQSFISNRSTVSSPYTIAVTHQVAGDSIYTHTVVTKTDTVSGAPAAYVVVIEKLIHFLTAPGFSGDFYFRNVMKEMLPTATGATLPAMNTGDSVVYNYSWKLAHVYDTTELAVISFVQDRTTHEVYQAGYSAPNSPEINDAGITAVNIPYFGCDSFAPVVTLYNFGSAPITTCTINYQIGNTAPASVPWSGTLAPGASVNVTLPNVFGYGYNPLIVFTSNPNGSTDYFHSNDTTATYFSIAAPAETAPLTEGFQETFPPAYWALASNWENKVWQQANAGAFGTSTLSAKMDCYDYIQGLECVLYPPALDFSVNTSPVFCTFDVAYGYNGASEDSLELEVSTDCGATWTMVYAKSDTSLATATASSRLFVPNDTQWRHETVDLSAYNGQAGVQVAFCGISGFGNDIYLDNVNIAVVSGINPAISTGKLSVFPNPGNGSINVQLSSVIENASLNLYSVEGQCVMQQHNLTGSNFALDIAKQAKGIYFLQVTDGANNVLGMEKIVVD